MVKIGFAKIGNIGTAPLIEFLLDERADREDVDVRVVSSGAKMNPAQAEEVATKLLDFKPYFAIVTSPNATLPGPAKAREILSKANIPTLVISDGPTKKIAKQLEETGFGYIIIDADSMIGARREFLDPIEMAVFNADIIKILAVTGVFNIVYTEIDNLIATSKKGEKLSLPHIIVDKEKAATAAGFQNPYAKAKAMAAYEISRRAADLTTEGCFVIREAERYIPLITAAHEMIRKAASLADEAREIEKQADSVLRKPHHRDGTILTKRKLMEKPTRPGGPPSA